MATVSLAAAIGYGLASARPAAGIAGRLYYATDTSTLSRDNGSSWDSLTLAGGTGTLATVEEVDGSPTDSAVTKLVLPNGTLSIASHVATYTPAGGGGMSHSYEGYNTVGGSSESLVSLRWYAKAFTPAASGMLLNVGAHLKWQADWVWYFQAAIFADNGGVPGNVISAGTHGPSASNTQGIDLHQGTEVARWLHFPVSAYLTGGTQYWMGISTTQDNGAGAQTYPLIYYDTSGSDRIWTNGHFLILDGQSATQSDSTKKYSIRGDFVS